MKFALSQLRDMGLSGLKSKLASKAKAMQPVVDGNNVSSDTAPTEDGVSGLTPEQMEKLKKLIGAESDSEC